uniref:Immunoglobulin domain-containing protein n=1 Tax=Nomascus leucogenys TaxID=61853 RepID=G1QGP3_NOMLE
CLSLTGPSSVTGSTGGSLRVWCQYERQYNTSCESIVETKGEEKVERNGRVSIRDHPEALAFTVTMQNLNEDDAGSYWCEIQTVWILDSWSRDPSALVRVYVSPATTTPRRTTRPATPPIFLVVKPGTGEVLTQNS